MRNKLTALGLSLAAALAVVVPAQADSLILSYSETNNGSANIITGVGTSTGLNVPGTYFYGHSLGPLTHTIVGSPGAGFEFYDDFKITVAPTAANSIASTINFADILGISNFQVRLYSADSNPLPAVTTPPVGYVNDFWSLAINSGTDTGSFAVLPTTNLSAGNYWLEVRGNVTGSYGGSYSGTLNVAPPVPIPGAIWMFGAAISGLFAARRRSAV